MNLLPTAALAAGLLAVLVGLSGPAAAQVTPTSALVGQSLRTCSAVQAPLDVVVEKADWRPGPNNQQLVVLVVRLTNMGTRPTVPYRATLLRDERGRQFEQPPASAGVNLTALASEFGVQPPVRELAPGQTESFVWAFLVPPEVQGLTLASSGSGQCAGTVAGPVLGVSPVPVVPTPLTARPAPTLTPNYTFVQSRLYGSAENPVSPGTPADVGNGWRLSVGDVLLSANNLVLDASAANPAVPPDAQDVLMHVSATYTGPAGTRGSAQEVADSLQLIGASGQVYTTDSCGLGPDPLASREVDAGETVTGTVCWQVRSADTGGMLLVYAPVGGGARVFFRLPFSLR